MPESIVQGLFGISPYEVEQQQNAGMFKAADQYAAQTPFQQATGQMYRAGGMFGGAGAEAAGMANPRVQEAQQVQAIMQQIDPSSADGLTKGALLANQMKNPRLAYMLAQAAQKRRMEEADIKQKEAHAKYWEQGGAKKTLDNIAALSDKEMASKLMVTFNTAQLASKDMNFPDEESRAAWVDAQVSRAKVQYMAANPNAGKSGAAPMPPAALAAPGTVPQQKFVAQEPSPAGFPVVSPVEQTKRNAERIAVLLSELEKDPTNPALIQEISNAKAASESGKPFDEFKLRNVPVPTMAVSAEAKARAKATGEKDPAILSRAAAATEGGKGITESNLKQHERVKVSAASLPKIIALEQQLQKGDVTTGLAADFRIATNKMLALLGGREGAKKATDSEIADVMMGSDVFPLIQSLGIGARGMDTPAERDFMRKVLTGSLSLEKGTLLEMTRFRKEALQREIDQWNSRREKGELNSYFADTSQTNENVKVPAAKASSAIRKYNPATGKIE